MGAGLLAKLRQFFRHRYLPVREVDLRNQVLAARGIDDEQLVWRLPSLAEDRVNVPEHFGVLRAVRVGYRDELAVARSQAFVPSVSEATT